MLQFPGFMTQFPWSTRMIPSSFLLPSQSPNGDLLLAMEEAEFEEKGLTIAGYRSAIPLGRGIKLQCNEIRMMNSNLPIIGKTSAEECREDHDNEADDEDADNGEDSEGDDFQQETS